MDETHDSGRPKQSLESPTDEQDSERIHHEADNAEINIVLSVSQSNKLTLTETARTAINQVFGDSSIVQNLAQAITENVLRKLKDKFDKHE